MLPRSSLSRKNLIKSRNIPVLAAFLIAALAATALSGSPRDPYTAAPADDGLSLLLSGCSLSDSVIAPPRTQTVIRYSIIGPESVRVAVLVDSAGRSLGFIQRFVKQAASRTYAVPFEGILPGVIADRILDDGFYEIRVRAFSDTGRVEQCILPVEIDRLPPRILSFSVNGDTARAVTVRNGDTILIDALMDRPHYKVNADFSRLDNDTLALFTSVVDQGGGRYTIRRFVSEANTLPDGTGLPVTLTFTDLAGNILKDSSLRFCLSNRPPRLVSSRILNEAGPLARNGDRVTLETVWDSSDTLLTVTADFSSIDARWAPANLSVGRFTGNRYEIRYTISVDNTIEDGPGHIVTFAARDRGCGVSATGTIALTLDNSAGSRPVLDPLPVSSRSSSITVGGDAPGSRRVVLKRNDTVVDTVLTDENGRFEGTARLVPGRNTIVAEGFDGAGNKTAASLPASIVYLTEAFLTIPRRFATGGTIELGLDRTGQSARVEIWNLSGDLLAVLEDGVSRDLYRFTWDGRNSSGKTVAAGPLLAAIEVLYSDGTRDMMREAFVLVKR